MGPEKAAASVMFHSLAGGDAVSFFFGVSRKTCREVWMSDPKFTQLFLGMLASPEKFQDDFFHIERFVSLMYDKTSVYDKANAARKYLFTKKRYIRNHSTYSVCSSADLLTFLYCQRLR